MPRTSLSWKKYKLFTFKVYISKYTSYIYKNFTIMKKQKLSKSDRERFLEKMSSAEEGDLIVENPTMSREDALKHLGLDKDPAKEGIEEAINQLNNQ